MVNRVSQNKLAEFLEQNSDKRFLDHFWPSRLYYTVLANFGNFGPLLTASTALPTFFRTFHQFDCRAYHFLATAPWKLWPPMWRWELPPISLIFSPAFRLMSTTTHICYNHPNRWLEKGVKFSNGSAKKQCIMYEISSLRCYDLAFFVKMIISVHCTSPDRWHGCNWEGELKKHLRSVNASSIWCWTRMNQILFSGCSRILRGRCLQRTSLCWKQILPKLPSWRLRFSLLMSSPIQFVKCLRSEQPPLQPTTTNKTNTDRGDQKSCIFAGSFTSDDVVEAVLRGFKQGEQEFGVVARVLLCCIRSLHLTCWVSICFLKLLSSNICFLNLLLSNICLSGNLYIQGPASV